MVKWQSRWGRMNEGTNGRENKLGRVKTSVDPWKFLPGVNRRNEVKIARLRNGHTRLTQSCLMTHGRPPECSKCRDSPLTPQQSK